MARQNYGYEKRQKEMAKQKKREEKRRRKLDKHSAAPGEGPEHASDEASSPDEAESTDETASAEVPLEPLSRN